VRSNYLSLQEPELVRFRRERADSLNIAFTSVFPGAVFVQISNSLAVRQIRPRGIGEVEIFQTMLGYADDPPDLTLHRLRQANLVGPAGLVSMEGRTNGEMRSQPRERASGVGLVLLTAG
jgi:anthranilate 1,2-dioxygenase large subunit